MADTVQINTGVGITVATTQREKKIAQVSGNRSQGQFFHDFPKRDLLLEKASKWNKDGMGHTPSPQIFSDKKQETWKISILWSYFVASLFISLPFFDATSCLHEKASNFWICFHHQGISTTSYQR